MTKEIIHGLGAHADIPVSPEEDRAFEELTRQSSPTVTATRDTRTPERKNITRFPAPG